MVSYIFNPRRACAARVTLVVVSVCLCVCVSVCLSVCVSVKSHLTSGASVRRENAATHSAGNEGQKSCGDFFETAPLPRSIAPSHDGHTSGRPFFLGITRMRTVHTKVLQGSRCDARAQCRKLYIALR